jgi:hypothetical protein
MKSFVVIRFECVELSMNAHGESGEFYLVSGACQVDPADGDESFSIRKEECSRQQASAIFRREQCAGVDAAKPANAVARDEAIEAVSNHSWHR